MSTLNDIPGTDWLRLSNITSLLLVAVAALVGCGGGGGGGGGSRPPPVADTTPPTVSINTPDAGTTFTTARNVTIVATADDDSGFRESNFFGMAFWNPRMTRHPLVPDGRSIFPTTALTVGLRVPMTNPAMKPHLPRSVLLSTLRRAAEHPTPTHRSMFL